MSLVQRKAVLKAEGFFPHKKNVKGTTIIYSRKHPSAKFVRVVIDSGIGKRSGKVVGKIGVKHFLFLGLERMGGVLVYDITDPMAPVYQDYLNSRETWDVDPDAGNLEVYGDLGPEGLVFIPPADSANGTALRVVGNEVSGFTAIYEVQRVFNE